MEESQLIINSPLTANDRRRTDRQVIMRLRAPEQIIAYFHARGDLIPLKAAAREIPPITVRLARAILIPNPEENGPRIPLVMAGLEPAIHRSSRGARDARDAPWPDDESYAQKDLVLVFATIACAFDAPGKSRSAWSMSGKSWPTFSIRTCSNSLNLSAFFSIR